MIDLRADLNNGEEGAARRQRMLLIASAVSILFILYMMPYASTSPVVNLVEYSPSSEVWVGEDITYIVNCSDANNSITSVVSEVVGEGGYMIPNRTMVHIGNGLYETSIDKLYLTEPKTFTNHIYCKNNVSETTTHTSTFKVSNLSMEVLSGSEVSAFIGEQIELDLNVRKNGMKLVSGVSFFIKIDGSHVPLKVDPPYDPVRGWILYIDAPSSEGRYEIEVIANYGRADSSVLIDADIDEPVDFTLDYLSTDLLSTGDDVTLYLTAQERGSLVELNAVNTRITVGSANAPIKEIYPTSSYYVVKFETPDLSSGEYQLTASVELDGHTYRKSRTVSVAVNARGEFKDKDDRGVYVEMKFVQDGAEKFRVKTNTDGTYDNKIKPGKYDITFLFPEAAVILTNIDVHSFSDPMTYYYSDSDDAAPGLHVAAFFAFETTLDYSDVTMELKYDESRVSDETEIKVYRCRSWSSSKETCYNDWEEISGAVNSVNNVVTIEVDSFSAYAIGTLKALTLDYSIEKETLILGEIVQIHGLTLDAFNRNVGEVNLSLSMEGSDISSRTTSDKNGIYSFTIRVPDKEGDYKIKIKADKYPYLDGSISVPITVKKSKSLSITGPDTVKAVIGKESAIDFIIGNTGQSDLKNLNISLSGLPRSYYVMSQDLIDLVAGSSKEINVHILTPEDAVLGTRSVTLNVEGKDISDKKIFGFTIEESGTEKEVETPSSSTGFITLPDINNNTLYLIVIVVAFAAISFTTAILLKRRKINNGSLGLGGMPNLSDRKKSEHRDLVRGELDKIKSQISISDSADGAVNEIEAAWDKLKEKWAGVEANSLNRP